MSLIHLESLNEERMRKINGERELKGEEKERVKERERVRFGSHR